MESPTPSDTGTPSSAQAARQEMLAKRRQAMMARKKKTAGGGMLMSSDTPTRHQSAKKSMARKTSTDALVNDVVPPVAEMNRPGDDTETIPLPAEDKLASKFELLMQEEGLGGEYTPTSEMRFEPAAVMPSAGGAQRAATVHAGGQSPLFFDDAFRFVTSPAPKGIVVQCRITRDRGGLEKGMYPTYLLELERPEEDGVKRVFLLAGRKRKKSKSSNYVISMDPTDLSREGSGFVSKLRSNFLGTHFTVYDNGFNAIKSKDVSEGEIAQPREELAGVFYETNLLGFKGPRKMTVVIPACNEKDQRIAITPTAERDTIVERYKSKRLDDLLVLRNKQPTWNEETNSYVLNFYGRVRMASVKNFQIVHESDENYIIMQFGRVDQQSFSMDFQYPMSACQAFSIALSSFDGKLACE